MIKKHLSGVKVAHRKNTEDSPAVQMPIPDRVTLPMLQNMGAPCKVLVKVGDEVKVGQVIGDTDEFLSAPIHASVSGKVTSVHEIVIATGVRCPAVTIESDKLQTVHESVSKPVINSREDVIKAMRASGLVGLGGAGFPTHIKYSPKNPETVDTLVVNAAECEPYITSDFRTMMDETSYLVKGIDTLIKYFGFKQVVIGIEDNKPRAIEKLNKEFASNSKVKIVTLRSKYPQGAEKVLVYETTGRVVQEGRLPADAGVIVSNVTTITVFAKYLETGMPLVSRTVTVDGGAIAQPKNVIAPLGTSFKDIFEFCGGYKSQPAKILMGGPMMGIPVYSDEETLVKNNNAILAFNEQENKKFFETPCIRCGRCVRACPFDLMPRAIEMAFLNEQVDTLKELKANLCMECGCCSYVCPAKRQLVMTNKLAKKMLREKAN